MKWALGVVITAVIIPCAASTSPAEQPTSIPVIRRPTFIAIIVNKKNPISSLTTSELRSIFLKKKQTWDNGKTIIPLNAALKSKLRGAFEKHVLKMSAKEAGNYWVKQLVKGRTTAPRIVAASQITKRLVSALKGAIAYLEADQADSSVKVLKINGLRPGDEAYPIKY